MKSIIFKYSSGLLAAIIWAYSIMLFAFFLMISKRFLYILHKIFIRVCVCACMCLFIWKQHKHLQKVEKNKGQWFLSWTIMQQWKMVELLLHLTLWINLTYIYRIIPFIILQKWADNKWLLTWQYSISKSRFWLHSYMWTLKLRA